MTEHGFLFMAAMVKAMLDDRKLQTRRPARSRQRSECGSCPWDRLVWDERVRMERNCLGGEVCLKVPRGDGDGFADGETTHRVYPRVATGDAIWVRETWAPVEPDADWNGHVATCTKESQWPFPWDWDDTDRKVGVVFRVDGEAGAQGLYGGVWRPSMAMPRWASRLTLDVVSVRGQRVQDISEADAQREGWDWSNHNLHEAYDPVTMDTARRWFLEVWDAAYGVTPGLAVADNPWAWVYNFKVKRVENRRQL